LIAVLPYREKRTKITERYFNYLIVKNTKEIFIQKRTGNGIWKNLYELPLIETPKPLKKNIKEAIGKFLGTKNFSMVSGAKEISQMLSHRKIHFRFIEIELKNFDSFKLNNSKKIKLKALARLAFPKTIHLVLHENSLL